MSQPLTLVDLPDAREASFVAALFDLGGPQHAGQAALRAGYADTLEEAERAASFLLGSSRISRVITGEIKARFDVAAAAAFNTLLEVCTDQGAPANARIGAAEHILARSSLGAVPSRSTQVVANVGIEELLAQLDEMERAQQQTVEGKAVEVSRTATPK